MVSIDPEFFENFFSNIQAIIFDMDGTLFDLNVNWQKVKSRLGEHAKKNYKLGDGNIFQALFTGFREVERQHGKHAVEELENMLAVLEYNDAKEKAKPRELYTKGMSWIKNKVKEIESRTDRGGNAKIKFAIVSSNFKKTLLSVLEKHEKMCDFDMIVARDDVEAMKPNPEGLLRVVDKFDLTPSRCIYIGDLKSDEEAAKAWTAFLYAKILNSISK